MGSLTTQLVETDRVATPRPRNLAQSGVHFVGIFQIFGPVLSHSGQQHPLERRPL